MVSANITATSAMLLPPMLIHRLLLCSTACGSTTVNMREPAPGARWHDECELQCNFSSGFATHVVIDPVQLQVVRRNRPLDVSLRSC